MRTVVFALIAFSFVSGCSSKQPELKSPCVGIEGSPCGAKWPVNDQWHKQNEHA